MFDEETPLPEPEALLKMFIIVKRTFIIRYKKKFSYNKFI